MNFSFRDNAREEKIYRMFISHPTWSGIVVNRSGGWYIYVISFSYEEITRPKKPSLVLYPPPSRLA